MYDEGTRFGEAMTVSFGQTLGVDVRIARISNTDGSRMDSNDGRVASDIIVQALRDPPLTG
jgi:UDP-glucuronate decarboxylase